VEVVYSFTHSLTHSLYHSTPFFLLLEPCEALQRHSLSSPHSPALLNRALNTITRYLTRHTNITGLYLYTNKYVTNLLCVPAFSIDVRRGLVAAVAAFKKRFVS
jgi:hypothetical protein